MIFLWLCSQYLFLFPVCATQKTSPADVDPPDDENESAGEVLTAALSCHPCQNSVPYCLHQHCSKIWLLWVPIHCSWLFTAGHHQPESGWTAPWVTERTSGGNGKCAGLKPDSGVSTRNQHSFKVDFYDWTLRKVRTLMRQSRNAHSMQNSREKCNLRSLSVCAYSPLLSVRSLFWS